MTNFSKNKGYRLEKKLVDIATEEGLEARRAWGSDGRSIGLPANVDVEIISPKGKWYIQAKKRKAIANYIFPTEGNIQVIEANRKPPFAVLPYELFLALIK